MYELKQRRAIVHHDVGCVEEQQPVAQVRELLLLLGPQRSAAASVLVARMRSRVYGGAYGRMRSFLCCIFPPQHVSRVYGASSERMRSV